MNSHVNTLLYSWDDCQANSVLINYSIFQFECCKHIDILIFGHSGTGVHSRNKGYMREEGRCPLLWWRQQSLQTTEA